MCLYVMQIKLVVGCCCRTVLRGWTVVDAVGWFRTFFDGVWLWWMVLKRFLIGGAWYRMAFDCVRWIVVCWTFLNGFGWCWTMLNVSWWCIFGETFFVVFSFWTFLNPPLSEHSSQNSTQGSQMTHVLSFNLLLKGPNASFSSVELVTAAACK